MVNVDFCYRIEKEAEWGENEAGEPCEVYAKIAMKLGRVPSESEYDITHKELVSSLAKNMGIKDEYITPISYQEWAENQDETEE